MAPHATNFQKFQNFRFLFALPIHLSPSVFMPLEWQRWRYLQLICEKFANFEFNKSKRKPWTQATWLQIQRTNHYTAKSLQYRKGKKPVFDWMLKFRSWKEFCPSRDLNPRPLGQWSSTLSIQLSKTAHDWHYFLPYLTSIYRKFKLNFIRN